MKLLVYLLYLLLSVFLSVFLSVCLSLCLSVSLSVYLSNEKLYKSEAEKASLITAIQLVTKETLSIQGPIESTTKDINTTTQTTLIDEKQVTTVDLTNSNLDIPQNQNQSVKQVEQPTSLKQPEVATSTHDKVKPVIAIIGDSMTKQVQGWKMSKTKKVN